MSAGRLFDARGQRPQKTAQGVNFKDHGWSVRIQDKHIVICVHANHEPILLMHTGEVFELHGDTALELKPTKIAEDETQAFADALANHIALWLRKRVEIEKTDGGGEAETPESMQPAGEAT